MVTAVSWEERKKWRRGPSGVYGPWYTKVEADAVAEAFEQAGVGATVQVTPRPSRLDLLPILPHNMLWLWGPVPEYPVPTPRDEEDDE